MKKAKRAALYVASIFGLIFVFLSFWISATGGEWDSRDVRIFVFAGAVLSAMGVAANWNDL